MCYRHRQRSLNAKTLPHIIITLHASGHPPSPPFHHLPFHSSVHARGCLNLPTLYIKTPTPATTSRPVTSACLALLPTPAHDNADHGTAPRDRHPLNQRLQRRLLQALHPLQHHPPPASPLLRCPKALLRLRLPPQHPRRPSRRRATRVLTWQTLAQIDCQVHRPHTRATSRPRSVPQGYCGVAG